MRLEKKGLAISSALHSTTWNKALHKCREAALSDFDTSLKAIAARTHLQP